MTIKSVNLGSEHDAELKTSIISVLKSLKAKKIGRWFGIGGSQELSNSKFKIKGGYLTIEIETYIGVTLEGEEELVELFLIELGKRGK